MIDFKNIGLQSNIIIALEKIGINSPTEVQKQSIPVALSGNDILASSQTGSGKTLAYLLPAISSILSNKSKVLVLTPTREIATQVTAIFNKLTRKLDIVGAEIIGGEPFPKQIAAIRKNPDIIIGTPGRVIDHLSRGSIKLEGFNVLILDEMDRMLDMGMREQLDKINNYVSKKRQVLMFSATVPEHILKLSSKYLSNPQRISVGSVTKAAPEIQQEFIELAEERKYIELDMHLAKKEGTVITFVKTKRGADKLAKNLKNNGHKAEAIHGDLKQSKRAKIISDFRLGKIRILVATDVASRGLDINHVRFVFNYDLPMCPEDYLHRIGRTGRAGAKGHAISFVSPLDRSRMYAIDKLINKGKTTDPKEYKLGKKKKFNNKNKNFKGKTFNEFKGTSLKSERRNKSKFKYRKVA